MEISPTNDSLILQLLGSPQVLMMGQSIQDLTSIKSQAILYYLAMEHRPKSRLALAGLLWPQKSDSQARVNLRQALRRLRLSIDEYLITSRDTVELDFKRQVRVDALLFESMVKRGLEGDIPTLEQAIVLYGGEFLAAFYVDDAPEFEDWIILQRERLRSLAIQGLQKLSVYYVGQRVVNQGLQVTRQLLAIEPWHEESYRNMMRLLALDGQVSAALVQYETCRQILAAELGVEPAPDTTLLYEQIRDGKNPALDQRQEATDVLSPVPASHNLPRQFTSFVGRHDDFVQLNAWLDDPNCALLTIRGPGGVGKTRLAIEIGRHRLNQYPDGVWFTDLAPLDHVENFYATIAAGLGMALMGHMDVKSQVLEYLKKKTLLLILDNFEQVMRAVEEIVAILRTAVGSQIIVTSREALDLQSEWLYEVHGLPVPESIDAIVEPVSAVDLFVERLQQRRSGLGPSPSDYEYILQICRLVDGMPLAIELAASLTRSRALAEIAADVTEDLNHLSVSVRDIPARQRSLRAIFEYSWCLLGEEEQTTLARLSVFRGSFATVAAAIVAGASDMRLNALYDKSFLGQPVPSRYEMHQVLQQFAIEKAVQLGTDQETKDRHSEYYLEFVHQRENNFLHPEAVLAAAEIQNELTNIRKAWEWATEQANAQALERSWIGLARFFGSKGLLMEGEYYFGKAVDNLEEVYCQDQEMPFEIYQLLGRLKAQQARFLHSLARYAEAIQLAQEVISLNWEPSDPVAVAMSYQVWGSALSNQGQGDHALEVLTQGLQIAQGAELHRIEASIRSKIGVLFLRQGDFELAETHFEEASACFDRLGDVGGQAAVNNNLAILHVRQGKYKQAQQYYERALEIYRQIGGHGGVGLLLANLGIVASHQGDFTKAETLVRQGLAVCRQTGERWLESALLNTLGSIRLRLGDYENARKLLEKSLGFSREIGSLYSESEALSNLGMLACQLDDYETALVYSRQGLDAARAAGDQNLTGYAWMGRGRAQEGLARLQAAADTYTQVLGLRLKGGPQSLVIEVKAGLARVTLAEGDEEGALDYVNSYADFLLEQGKDGHILDGAEEPLRIYHTAYHVLRAVGDERSTKLQEAAVALLKGRAAQISDRDLRQSFLRNVAVHRQIMGDLAASYV